MVFEVTWAQILGACIIIWPATFGLARIINRVANGKYVHKTECARIHDHAGRELTLMAGMISELHASIIGDKNNAKKDRGHKTGV